MGSRVKKRLVCGVEIEPGIPMPPFQDSQELTAILNQMKVGDSVVLPVRRARRLQRLAEMRGGKLLTRGVYKAVAKADDPSRCWLVKELAK